MVSPTQAQAARKAAQTAFLKKTTSSTTGGSGKGKNRASSSEGSSHTHASKNCDLKLFLNMTKEARRDHVHPKDAEGKVQDDKLGNPGDGKAGIMCRYSHGDFSFFSADKIEFKVNKMLIMHQTCDHRPWNREISRAINSYRVDIPSDILIIALDAMTGKKLAIPTKEYFDKVIAAFRFVTNQGIATAHMTLLYYIRDCPCVLKDVEIISPFDLFMFASEAVDLQLGAAALRQCTKWDASKGLEKPFLDMNIDKSESIRKLHPFDVTSFDQKTVTAMGIIPYTLLVKVTRGKDLHNANWDGIADEYLTLASAYVISD